MRWQYRHVTVAPDAGCGGVSVCYPGIAIACLHEGLPVRELWLPSGEDPTEADDEVLICALRDAVR